MEQTHYMSSGTVDLDGGGATHEENKNIPDPEESPDGRQKRKGPTGYIRILRWVF